MSVEKLERTLIDISPEVIEQAKSGDADAFALIVEAYQNPVYNLCYRMLYNEGEAEDADQETFWKAWSNFIKYDSNRSFSTWILSIAAHYCIDQQRKRRVPETEIDESMEEIIPEKSPLPEIEVSRKEDELRLKRLLSNLNEIDRAAVIFRYWYDFSDHEIAENLSISESAVKSRLFRARKELALLWNECK
jgi:RNA polymerase sigma-70 factor (ECF subfamily)